MNETIKTLKNHASIRKFNGEKLTDVEVDEILESGMRGATAGNMMPYSIIKIRSKETLEKLSKSCDDQPFIAEADMALLFVVDSGKWHRYFESRGIFKKWIDFKGPQLGDFMLGMQDAMIAAQNTVVAAESLGIGTCYIGDIMENVEYHRELFGLPEYTMAATLIVFGRYDVHPAPRPRFKKEYIVFDEVYPPLTEEFINGMFASKEATDGDFAMKFYERKIASPFFKEMIRSIQIYLKDWMKG